MEPSLNETLTKVLTTICRAERPYTLYLEVAFDSGTLLPSQIGLVLLSRVTRRGVADAALPEIASKFPRRRLPMPRFSLLRPGYAYSFLYPRYNYVGLPDRTERRRIIVESVRDTKAEPLDAETVSINPSLRRGRWLVTGRDLDHDATRSFYTDSMLEVQQMTEDQREPLRKAQYVVLSSAGWTAFQSLRLGEAIAFLLGRQTGILCKVLGPCPAMEPPKELTSDVASK